MKISHPTDGINVRPDAWPVCTRWVITCVFVRHVEDVICFTTESQIHRWNHGLNTGGNEKQILLVPECLSLPWMLEKCLPRSTRHSCDPELCIADVTTSGRVMDGGKGFLAQLLTLFVAMRDARSRSSYASFRQESTAFLCICHAP